MTARCRCSPPSSPSAKGATRKWTSLQDFASEVGNARVYEGLHYRFSIEAGADMGQSIGALAAARILGTGDLQATAATVPAGERVRSWDAITIGAVERVPHTAD